MFLSHTSHGCVTGLGPNATAECGTAVSTSTSTGTTARVAPEQTIIKLTVFATLFFFSTCFFVVFFSLVLFTHFVLYGTS